MHVGEELLLDYSQEFWDSQSQCLQDIEAFRETFQEEMQVCPSVVAASTHRMKQNIAMKKVMLPGIVIFLPIFLALLPDSRHGLSKAACICVYDT